MDATPPRSSAVEKIVVRCQYMREERNCSGKEKKTAWWQGQALGESLGGAVQNGTELGAEVGKDRGSVSVPWKKNIDVMWAASNLI